jgi:amidase
MHHTLPSLATADAEQLVHGLQQGLFHSIDLVNVSGILVADVDVEMTDHERQAYIARIEEVNDSLKAVLQINPDARSIALQLDDERSRGILRR